MSVLQALRNSVDETCIVERNLRKQGCRVSLKNTPQSKIIIDFDHDKSPLRGRITKCDFLYVDEIDSINRIAPLELTTGVKSPGSIKKQLQAAAVFCQDLVTDKVNIQFVPVYVSKRVTKYMWGELRKKRYKIKFLSKEVNIRFLKCKGELVSIFK